MHYLDDYKVITDYLVVIFITEKTIFMIIYDCQKSDNMMIKKCYTIFQSKTNVTKIF